MHDHRYVARFRWTRRDLLLLPASLVFVIAGAAIAGSGEPVTGGLAVAFGFAYLLLSTLAVMSRRVAFAVTAEGVTLGQVPPWPASRTAFVPWPDIEAIVLWRQAASSATVQYIGVQRLRGAPPLPGSAKNRRLRRLNRAFAPANLPEELVADSRQIGFWRLDKARLAAAVNQFAPHVPIVDKG